MVKFHFTKEPDHVSEMRFGLSRKPGNKCGSQCYTWNFQPNLLEHFPDPEFGFLPLHTFKHLVMRVLQRHINVAADFGFGPDKLNHLRVQKGRVTI